MTRIHLVLLWHMHQPQYRDPATGEYLLPWTRLHALKDYWGMVKTLEKFPGVHATFNFVPLLAAQIEEYASGKFREPWFELAFAPADSLTHEQREEILTRAFQVNENLVRRWPRFAGLHAQVQSGGAAACIVHFSAHDWRDLQTLSQLAWMDEEYLAHDPVVAELARKGRNFTEEDKEDLRQKQHELLNAVLPEYRLAAERGQIEISTTPYYHPILPLLCDSEIARVSNPQTPMFHPPFRHPEDAQEQLLRARRYHERVFGKPPNGLWPSEGCVSDQALEMAMELGFRWFASDEGVLGRSRNLGFWRDAAGYPENASRLYTPWKFRRGAKEITGLFRDHYLSDLIGFVYSRMDAELAAEDLHRRIRMAGERAGPGEPVTLSLILDGENAWEFYPGNGREFLRRFYERIERDPDIRALTASEAIEESKQAPVLDCIFPASWINANFDIWIGHAEDVRGWELLRDARQAYARAAERAQPAARLAPLQTEQAYESVLAAEGSDWFWWFGPEHTSANDTEFDELFRKQLTEIYALVEEPPPEELAHPIKRRPERARRVPPQVFLKVEVDGRESGYFEWLGAGFYTADRRSGAMHGRSYILSDLMYGFGPNSLFLRVDPLGDAFAEKPECQIRVTLWDSRETRITLPVQRGKLGTPILEQGGACLLHPEKLMNAALGRILELGLARELFDLRGRKSLLLGVALWAGGLPVDILPPEGLLEIPLGEENFSWLMQ